MKILVFSIFFLCLSINLSVAQNTSSVKGIVVDIASNIKLANSSISILKAKDSTLVKFTRAAQDGSFTISNLTKEKFILLVTYPGYADFVEHFTLDSTKQDHDFGDLNLFLKSKLLEEVIIKGNVTAIKIKGDTTEYNAKAFVIEANSKVEDLLKQLPGIEVDKDGKITAQGQKVNKVLVDGEEFFGDDPTLVTKNIRGDMVDKVQVYDKKSDQAAFTGIDDGVKDKTINIKLKENKKNGYFGKLDAGLATSEYTQSQGMFNAFKAKKKFSAYGTLGNTGQTGLGWRDNEKYSSSNIEMSEEGYFMISGSDDELSSFDGRYNGEGIPLAKSGGLHYDSKWNNDKESLNTNYKVGSIGIDGTKNYLSQNNLPTGIINNNSDQAFNNYMFRQKLDITYQIKLDSSSNLKISVDGTLKDNNTENSYSALTTQANNQLVNKSIRNLTNDGTQKMFNGTVFWNKKFKKAGRTMSINVKQSLNENDTKGFLNSSVDFYNEQGGISKTDLIDQYKTNSTSNTGFNTTLTYSEPFSKTFAVNMTYGFGINNSTADRKSFNETTPNNYETLDPLYSNNFKLDQQSNQVGAVFNYKKNKTLINFGTKVSDVKFEQVNLYTDQEYRRDFLNWNPQASYQYKFSQQKSIRFNYSGNSSQPSIDQIQPIRVNNDPLNITLGNPDLKPSFQNAFNLNYNSYKVLSGQSIYLSGNYSFINNPIVNNSTTNNSTGESTYQWFNLDKKLSNFGMYLYGGQKVTKHEIYIGINANVNRNIYFNLTNGALNKTTSYNYASSLSISQYKPKKYNFNVSIGPSYSDRKSSLQKDFNNSGWGLNSDVWFSVNLPGKMEISSNGSYKFTQKTQSFNQDFDRTIWNSSISKKFFKTENVRLSLSGNDLLNQNVGFDRSVNSNLITQNSYTTIKRYYMLSLAWDFNKMGGAVKPKK
ncbi:MAG: TonB-dependent receptor [Sphingobacteriales bacterium]|nr:TonB-dependent receptor [Sphingobacteriales bacterium]